MIDCWQKYTGDIVCGEKISHQHLSNIYYYTHFTLKGSYPDSIRNDVRKSLNKRFNGKILPYQPDHKFKFEIDRLKINV